MRSLTVYAQKAKEIAKKTPWLYKTLAQTYVDKQYPRHLFIETTADCNLSCDYCPRQQVKSHMDWALFKEIVEEAAHYGPRSFSLHLFGEPLLWPHILDGIDFIKQANRRNVVLLTTNGTHLNRFAGDLIRLGVDEIIWSWRREAKFKKETLARLKDSTLRNRGTRFRVRILKEVTPQKEIERWSKWPAVEIRDLHNYGGNVEVDQKPKERWPCYHLWFAPAVAWNGKVLICCADPHQKECVGDVRRSGVAQAWQGINSLRESHLRGEYKGICETCDVWKNYPNIFFSWQHTTSSFSENST